LHVEKKKKRKKEKKREEKIKVRKLQSKSLIKILGEELLM